MISGGIEVNYFAQIRLLLEAKFEDNPLLLILIVHYKLYDSLTVLQTQQLI